MEKKYDVIVIGAGPAGYVAAIRCAQLGLKTLCIDKWINQDNKPSLGGTCLNVGCIPSKALIESSVLYEQTHTGLAEHGIHANGISLDLTRMLARKDKIVQELTQGIAALLQANKIDFIHGQARLLANKGVEVSHIGRDERLTLNAAHIILATGSSPSDYPPAPYQTDYVVDSTAALSFSTVPKRLAVIGAGAIGLELGSVWRRLGADVIMLKPRDGFLPMADQQIAAEALKQFTSQGLAIHMGVKITGCSVKQKKVELHYTDSNGTHKELVDKVIVAVGRRPNTTGLLAPECGVELDERGFVKVDSQCRTATAGIYAIGDMVRGPMLAHKGSEEGMMVAELIAGKFAQVDLETIPSVIYTHPEIAWVGKTEQQLKAEEVSYRVGTFPLSANARARAMGEPHGLIKILADSKTDRVLGVHMIGAKSSELIAMAKIAMEFSASSEDLALTMFAHPTLTEAFHEAALSVDQRAIHVMQKKKK